MFDDITVVLGEIRRKENRKKGKFISIYFTGEHDIEDDSESVTFESKAVGISHPKFFNRLSSGEIVFDVGLLILETPIDFSNATFSHIRF